MTTKVEFPKFTKLAIFPKQLLNSYDLFYCPAHTNQVKAMSVAKLLTPNSTLKKSGKKQKGGQIGTPAALCCLCFIKTTAEGNAAMLRKSRRKRQEEVQPEPKTRDELDTAFDQVWDTQELAKDFIVIGIERPLIVVKRKGDGVVGTLQVQEMPRFYFDFQPGCK